jgi:putative flavoprotein involved in K+ transport
MLHFSDYREPAPFAGQRVIVVGAGNSAVQIATELATRARVTLATRAPIRFTPQRPLGRDIHFWSTASGLDHLPIGHLLRTTPASHLDGTGALADGMPLQSRGLSTTIPQLGYVGLEWQRSLASATLRGVGRDAAHVVTRLARNGFAASSALDQPSVDRW